MIIKTFFAGFGGQGVLSMGYTLAMAAMLDDKYVTYFPSYGAEVRGGTANCTVNVGDEEIASPIASEPDYIVALNRPSMLKFENWVGPGGFMFLNTSLVTDRPARPDIEVVGIPANDLAKEVANDRSANMVVLGALAKKTNIVSRDALARAITKIFEKKKKVLDASLKALDRGILYMDEEGAKK